jgi:hypothetical protein
MKVGEIISKVNIYKNFLNVLYCYFVRKLLLHVIWCLYLQLLVNLIAVMDFTCWFVWNMEFNYMLFWFFQYLYAQSTLIPELLIILVIFHHIPLLTTVYVSLLCILFGVYLFSCPILFMYSYNFTLLFIHWTMLSFILYYIWTVLNLIYCLQELIYTDFNRAFILRPVYKGSVEY